MLDCRREPSKGVRCCRIRSFLSNLASITGTRSSLSPGPTTAQKLTTSSIYQQVTKTSQGPTQRAKRSLAAWQEQVPKTDEGGMQNRCATRKELELQSFQRWIASSCPGGRGWVYHGELRCHSRLASQNRSTTKSSYGRIKNDCGKPEIMEPLSKRLRDKPRVPGQRNLRDINTLTMKFGFQT